MRKIIYIIPSFFVLLIFIPNLFTQFNTDYIGGIYTPQLDTPYIKYKNPNILNKNANNIKRCRIKSITEATQYYRKWKYEDTLYYENKYEYDTNGYLVKWKYLNTFITFVEWHGDFTRDPIDSALYIYNSDNLVSEKINYHKAYNSFLNYNYDSRGNLIRLRKIYDTLDNYTDTNLFKFDNGNNLIKEKKYWDYEDDTIFVVYDRINNLKVTCNSVYPDRKKEKLWELIYSKYKDTILFNEYRYNTVSSDKFIFHNNKLILEYSFHDDHIHRTEHYYYNQQNQIIKQKTKYWDQFVTDFYYYPKNTRFEDYNYNIEGFLNEIINYYSNRKPSYKTVFIYEYYE